MTTIAWDGQTLAADRMVSCGTTMFTAPKLHRHEGWLLAYSGDADAGEEMLAWFRRGGKPDDFPTNQRDQNRFAPMLAIAPSGDLQIYECTPYPVRLPPQPYALGSGRAFALAAMFCGKSAAQAVEVACVFDPHSGRGVDAMPLNPTEE